MFFFSTSILLQKIKLNLLRKTKAFASPIDEVFIRHHNLWYIEVKLFAIKIIVSINFPFLAIVRL